MTRPSKRDLRKELDELREDRDGVPVIVERETAKDGGYPIRRPADGSNRPYKNGYRGPPDPSEGEELVEALVAPSELTSAFASGSEGGA